MREPGPPGVAAGAALTAGRRPMSRPSAAARLASGRAQRGLFRPYARPRAVAILTDSYGERRRRQRAWRRRSGAPRSTPSSRRPQTRPRKIDPAPAPAHAPGPEPAAAWASSAPGTVIGGGARASRTSDAPPALRAGAACDAGPRPRRRAGSRPPIRALQCTCSHADTGRARHVRLGYASRGPGLCTNRSNPGPRHRPSQAAE